MPIAPFAMRIRMRGFSLMELAIVLTVVGIVLGGIWGVSETVYRNYKINLTLQQMHQILNNVRQYYAGSGRPAGWADGMDITNVLYGKGLIPSEMRSQNTGDTRTYHSMSNVRETGGAARGSFLVQVQGAAPSLPILMFRFYGLDRTYCIKFGQKLVQEERLKSGMQGVPDLRPGNPVVATVPATSLGVLNTNCLDTNEFQVRYHFRG